MKNGITLLGIGNIHQDAEGRFSLNDFHKASGGEDRTKPANFIRLESTQRLIDAISNCSELSNKASVSQSSGRHGGTHVIEELVYAYGEWISGEFHLKVIRAFKALAKGDIETAQQITANRSVTSLDSMRKQRAIELAISNADSLRDRFPTIGEKALQCVYSTLVNDAAGALVLPAPSLGHVKPLSATEVGKILGVSANMIGRVATANNVKTEEHGEWILGTAESNPSQRPTFVYNQTGVEKLRSLFVSANDIDGCAA